MLLGAVLRVGVNGGFLLVHKGLCYFSSYPFRKTAESESFIIEIAFIYSSYLLSDWSPEDGTVGLAIYLVGEEIGDPSCSQTLLRRSLIGGRVKNTIYFASRLNVICGPRALGH